MKVFISGKKTPGFPNRISFQARYATDGSLAASVTVDRLFNVVGFIATSDQWHMLPALKRLAVFHAKNSEY